MKKSHTTHKDTIDSLLKGHKQFLKYYFKENPALYRKLQQGQSPMAIVVGCADSRVPPTEIMGVKPGELFVLRDVANLVPACEPFETGYHGVSSGLQFGVMNLKIPHIIVLGHSQCGGIRALMSDSSSVPPSFIKSWMAIAEPAKQRVLASKCPVEEQAARCEEEAIKESLKNLLTFPWIKERVEKGELTLHGWHFDIKTGKLRILDSEKDQFQEVASKARSRL